MYCGPMTRDDDASQVGADEEAFEGADVENPTTDSDGTAKPGGLGKDGTIPNDPDGIAAGYTGTASNFNPEEDEDA